MIASSMQMAELVVEAGMDTGKRFPLKPQTRLGRAADNDIVLRDAQASRYHAMIALAGAEYVITDMNSANGTMVNGVRIRQPWPLHNGDLITIGSEQLRMRQG